MSLPFWKLLYLFYHEIVKFSSDFDKKDSAQGFESLTTLENTHWHLFIFNLFFGIKKPRLLMESGFIRPASIKLRKDRWHWGTRLAEQGAKRRVLQPIERKKPPKWVARLIVFGDRFR